MSQNLISGLSNVYSGNEKTQDAQSVTRYHWLDALRGLSAFTVVIHHLARNKITSTDDMFWKLFTMYGYIDPGLIAVFTFFLISGYVMRLSTKNESKNNTFLARRLFRVYPPYIICMLVATWLCFDGYFGEKYKITQTQLFEKSPIRYIVGIITMEFANLTGPENSPLYVDWTLAIELVFYIQIYLLVISKIRIPYKYIYMLFLVMSHVSDLCRYLPFLYAGTLFWDHKNNQLSGKSLKFFLALLPTSCLLRTLGLHGSSDNRYYYTICATIALFIFSVSYHRQYLTENKIVLFFGKISYSMYLIHMILISTLIQYQIPYWNFTIFTLIIIISSLFYKLVEIPSINAARRI